MNEGIDFLISRIFQYDFEKGVASLPEADQMIIQKILKIINIYCSLDLIENDVLYTL